jgi:hypothetical protein
MTEHIKMVGVDDMTWRCVLTPPSPHNTAVPERATKQKGHLGRMAKTKPDHHPVPRYRRDFFSWQGAQAVRWLEAGILMLFNHPTAIGSSVNNRIKTSCSAYSTPLLQSLLTLRDGYFKEILLKVNYFPG